MKYGVKTGIVYSRLKALSVWATLHCDRPASPIPGIILPRQHTFFFFHQDTKLHESVKAKTASSSPAKTLDGTSVRPTPPSQFKVTSSLIGGARQAGAFIGANTTRQALWLAEELIEGINFRIQFCHRKYRLHANYLRRKIICLCTRIYIIVQRHTRLVWILRDFLLFLLLSSIGVLYLAQCRPSCLPCTTTSTV